MLHFSLYVTPPSKWSHHGGHILGHQLATGAKMVKSHLVTVAWQAWHSQCYWEYIYIWELGISPTPKNTIYVSGNTVYISGNTAYVSGNTAYVSVNTVYISGNTPYVPGNTVYVSGNTAYISGNN